MKTIFKCGLVVILNLGITITYAQQNDTCSFTEIPNISICVDDMSGGKWAIGGNNNDRILHINRFGRIKDMNHSAHLPRGINYTSLVCFKKNIVFLGTNGQYVYCLRNNRLIQFNSNHGLTDSVITSIDWDVENEVLIVSSPQSRFVLLPGKRKTDFIFRKINEAGMVEDTVPELAQYVRKYFRKPVQKAICQTAANVDFRVLIPGHLSIHGPRGIARKLQPGDILIKRNDLQLTNLGIPGFWTHSAIYIGGKDELNRFFEGISMLNGMSATQYIEKHFPLVFKKIRYRRSLIIEAIGAGVVINPLAHIARSDYFAAIRPAISKEQLFDAVMKAFGFYNIPYDYLFSFSTDDALVCSELVYKSFKGSGVNFQMSTLAGNPFLSPNDIARQFCHESGTAHPAFSFLFFYKKVSSNGKVLNVTEKEFCNATGE